MLEIYRNFDLPFIIENIDGNYKGVVEARREFFAEHGLTPDTHFIASTGIEGASADVMCPGAMRTQ